MVDPSMILICLVFFFYPLTAAVSLGDIWVLGLAAGFAVVGALAELLVLVRWKRGRWVPALCVGALLAMEAVYQLEQFHITHMITGHDIWWAVFFGVAVLYVLLGTGLGWLAYWGWNRVRSPRGTNP